MLKQTWVRVEMICTKVPKYLIKKREKQFSSLIHLHLKSSMSPCILEMMAGGRNMAFSPMDCLSRGFLSLSGSLAGLMIGRKNERSRVGRVELESLFGFATSSLSPFINDAV